MKTRLAETIGATAACDAYRELVEHFLGYIAGLPYEIHFAPEDAAAELRAWLGSDVTLVPQVGGDLGQRLSHASREAFARKAGSDWIYLVGGDCPYLSPDVFAEADTAFTNGADAVIGPARDGGYYLLGLRAWHPSIFDGVPWSSPSVFAETKARLMALDWRTHVLGELEDVDEVDSWERARAFIRQRTLE